MDVGKGGRNSRNLNSSFLLAPLHPPPFPSFILTRSQAFAPLVDKWPIVSGIFLCLGRGCTRPEEAAMGFECGTQWGLLGAGCSQEPAGQERQTEGETQVWAEGSAEGQRHMAIATKLQKAVGSAPQHKATKRKQEGPKAENPTIFPAASKWPLSHAFLLGFCMLLLIRCHPF